MTTPPLSRVVARGRGLALGLCDPDTAEMLTFPGPDPRWPPAPGGALDVSYNCAPRA